MNLPDSNLPNELNYVGRAPLYEGDCVELVLPPDIHGVVKVVRVINISHRVLVLVDDIDSESIGNGFRAETSDRRGLYPTNFVELA